MEASSPFSAALTNALVAVEAVHVGETPRFHALQASQTVAAKGDPANAEAHNEYEALLKKFVRNEREMAQMRFWKTVEDCAWKGKWLGNIPEKDRRKFYLAHAEFIDTGRIKCGGRIIAF